MRPRHYILIALILLLGAYNLVRLRHAKPASPLTTRRSAPPSGPRPESPSWDAFDHAASLRDAPAPEFNPASAALGKQAEAPTRDPDLRGCSTWLEFYRQGILHPSRDPAWHNRSTEHLDSCVKFHRDVSS